MVEYGVSVMRKKKKHRVLATHSGAYAFPTVVPVPRGACAALAGRTGGQQRTFRRALLTDPTSAFENNKQINGTYRTGTGRRSVTTGGSGRTDIIELLCTAHSGKIGDCLFVIRKKFLDRVISIFRVHTRARAPISSNNRNKCRARSAGHFRGAVRFTSKRTAAVRTIIFEIPVRVVKPIRGVIIQNSSARAFRYDA